MDVLAEAHSWLSLNADPDAVEADGAVTPSTHLIRDLKRYAEDLAAAVRDLREFVRAYDAKIQAVRDHDGSEAIASAWIVANHRFDAARAALGETP